MDLIEILGGMLRQKASKPGRGPDILKDILNRGRESSPDTSRNVDQTDIERSAKELEDMLNVSRDRVEARPTSQPRRSQPGPSRAPVDDGVAVDSPYSRSREESSPSNRAPQNEQALILIRAMLNAAKADGRVSSGEQQAILKNFENASAETMQFLREELAKPLDVKAFASSVPFGMESQVYSMSLMAIEVDTNAEIAYLNDLAQCLRISEDVREQLHQRYGIAQVR